MRLARVTTLVAGLATVVALGWGVTPPAHAIVGGHGTPSTTVPWQAAINLSDGPEHLGCGGVIVAPSWILTAAHCVNGATPRTLRVYTGLDHARDVGSHAHAVDRVYVHRDYDPGAPTKDSAGNLIVDTTIDDDIALLHLARPLKVTATQQPISLPRGPDEARATTGLPLIVSGWGLVHPTGDTHAVILQSATVRMVAAPGARCGRYAHVPAPTLLCVGRAEGGVDSCDGDSGGPLTGRVGSRPVLVGLVSTGTGCADPRYPGLYTRVNAYVGWITGIMSGRLRR